MNHHNSHCACTVQEARLQRVASYRQVQAISQQLSLITAGRIESINDFDVPEGVILGQIPSNCIRSTRVEGGRRRAFYSDPDTGDELMLLPDNRLWYLDTKLLVLQLDQGPTCCGGMAPLGYIYMN